MSGNEFADLNVLVVDDDEQMQQLVSEMFKLNGVTQLTIASSGDEGLQELKKGDFDLILLDLFMPGTNGVDFLMGVCQQNSTIPCVLMSAAAEEMVKASTGIAKECGVNLAMVLRKPFGVEQFKDMLKTVTA